MQDKQLENLFKNDNEMIRTGKKWGKEMELKKPYVCSDEEFAEFFQYNKHHLQEIESFIRIVDDWIDQTMDKFNIEETK